MVERKVTGDMHVPAGEIICFADISKCSVTDTTYTTHCTTEDGLFSRHG